MHCMYHKKTSLVHPLHTSHTTTTYIQYPLPAAIFQPMVFHYFSASNEDATEPHNPGPPSLMASSPYDLSSLHSGDNSFYLNLYQDQLNTLGKTHPPHHKDESNLMITLTYPATTTDFITSLQYFFLYLESLTFSWDSYGNIISSTWSYVEQQCQQLLQDLLSKNVDNTPSPLTHQLQIILAKTLLFYIWLLLSTMNGFLKDEFWSQKAIDRRNSAPYQFKI